MKDKGDKHKREDEFSYRERREGGRESEGEKERHDKKESKDIRTKD